MKRDIALSHLSKIKASINDCEGPGLSESWLNICLNRRGCLVRSVGTNEMGALRAVRLPDEAMAEGDKH